MHFDILRLWRSGLGVPDNDPAHQLFLLPLTGRIPVRVDGFARPERGFVSCRPAADWEHGLLTGNGTIGAMVPGQPCDETLYLSHAGLFLPSPQAPAPVAMASRLSDVRRLCLEGRYAEAAAHITAARDADGFTEERDRFIAACAFAIRQPRVEIVDYQRSVDFLTAEAEVAVRDTLGDRRVRTVFASRAAKVLVLRITGDRPVDADLALTTLPLANVEEQALVDQGVSRIDCGIVDGHLSYRALFTTPNPDNPLAGYQVLGRVHAPGGEVAVEGDAIRVRGAAEILVCLRIELLWQGDDPVTTAATMQAELAALPSDHAALLELHTAIHAPLMDRVQFQVDAPEAERALPTEGLLAFGDRDPSLAQIERAFDAGRYNILCSTGYHPPNLQGLWSGTWSAPWYGSFTTNGNLQCAIAFLLMGDTPELMEDVFRYFDARWDGYRANAQAFFGLPGFHLPAQVTVSPRATNFKESHPHCFSHVGAAWILQFYYDYVQYTGDVEFLGTHAYPLMKEAAAFFEAFLTVRDEAGRLIFVPSYSPENAPGPEGRCPTAINATVDVAACRQLLQNCIVAAARLGCDDSARERWTALLASLPDYDVDRDGYFREWLWPGLTERHAHRHASQFYALYDRMPEEILGRPDLVAAVERSIRARLEHHRTCPQMAFGLVQLGLAAAHIGHAGLTGEIIDLLASRYWSTGMGSFHDGGQLFNSDISGGFPYLCASALVYADTGRIRFFPARPERWRNGCVRGLRLRGAITLHALSWTHDQAQATLVADQDQTIQVEAPDQEVRIFRLMAGIPQTILITGPDAR